jgi:NAD(P)-dependent dehydrogenase (short-subunit alcohol dehydrogenase family)
MKTILISGANRGLGLAYTAELLSRGHQVLATVRRSSSTAELDELAQHHDQRLGVYRTDLNSQPEVDALFDAIYDDHESLDGLINNAGVLTEDDTIESVVLNDLLENYFVNAAVPAMMAKAALPFLAKGHEPFVVNISSSFGSIELKRQDMEARYAYSMSKAALNMLTKTLATELDGRGITTVALHPGWVRTELGGPEAPQAPKEAAVRVVDTITALTIDANGSYLTADGRNLPW